MTRATWPAGWKANAISLKPCPAALIKKAIRQSFWVTNTDSAKSFQINATLKYVTDHAYFWVEDGVKL